VKGKDETSVQLLEQILSNHNLNEAYQQVNRNKGESGVDGMTVYDLKDYLREHKDEIRNQIRIRKYKPQPVLRVEIEKEDGGVRKLGIPTVVDRVIQQAISQVLMPIYELKFSNTSFGFRPGRSGEMAIIKSLEYMNDGYDWIVDIDLERFFDTERNWSLSLDQRIVKLKQTIIGWVNYFKIANMKSILTRIDEKLRSRIRVIIWKQWKVPKTQIKALVQLGIPEEEAKGLTYCRKGYRYIGVSKVVHRALSNKRLKQRGIPSALEHYL
jgi:retron-type reverse transcriptase